MNNLINKQSIPKQTQSRNPSSEQLINLFSHLFANINSQIQSAVKQSLSNHFNLQPINNQDKSHHNNSQYQQYKCGHNNSLYQQLSRIYKQCNGRVQIFIEEIQLKVSDKYMQIIKSTLNDLNQGQITMDQGKVIMSEQILKLNLIIMKVIVNNNNNNIQIKTFELLNRFQHDLIQYIKNKYPQGIQIYLPRQFLQTFQIIDRTNYIKYDILKNSNTYFGNLQDQQIIHQIKLFINKIIKQTQLQFPIFQTIIKQKAFNLNYINEKYINPINNNVINSNHTHNINNSKINQLTKQLNYKIGRKLNQNTPIYQNFHSGVLEIYSPQILRVLIKWVQNLHHKIYTIGQKSQLDTLRTFKKYIGRDQNNKQTKDNKIILQQITEFQFPDLIHDLTKQVKKIHKPLEQKNKTLLQQLHQFNSQFMRILQKGVINQKYISPQQVQIIKYSSYNTKFVEYMVSEQLLFAIKQLIKAGTLFQKNKRVVLDLIQFKVTNLLRCMVSGKKSEIITIYNNFLKLQQLGQIQIVKIKNRLKLPMCDIMIMLIMKGSFLICEAQLSLIESVNKENKINKHVLDLNHYLYELQRSPYGVLTQIGLNLTYKDNKVKYQNKISFKNNLININKCKGQHKLKTETIQIQKIPFICQNCSYFYNKYQNLFKLWRCNNCKYEICSKCLRITYKDIDLQMMIHKQIQRKVEQFNSKSKLRQLQQKQIIKGQQNENNMNQKLTCEMIIQILGQKINLYEIYGRQKRINCGKLMKILNQKFHPIQREQILLVVNFFQFKVDFKFYFYNQNILLIQNALNYPQQYIQIEIVKKYTGYQIFNVLVQNQQYIDTAFQTNISKNCNFILIFSSLILFFNIRDRNLIIFLF